MEESVERDLFFEKIGLKIDYIREEKQRKLNESKKEGYTDAVIFTGGELAGIDEVKKEISLMIEEWGKEVFDEMSDVQESDSGIE